MEVKKKDESKKKVESKQKVRCQKKLEVKSTLDVKKKLEVKERFEVKKRKAIVVSIVLSEFFKKIIQYMNLFYQKKTKKHMKVWNI